LFSWIDMELQAHVFQNLFWVEVWGGGVGQKKDVFAIFRWFSLSLCWQFLCCHNKQYGGAGTAADSLTALTASACLPCQSRQPVCEFSQKNSAAGEKIRPQAGNPPKS
jgi:hypothetical protein